jgi:hypothetical protein
MLDSTDLSIALYVPDATMRKFVEDRTLVALVLEGIADLDFIPPAWWERSHTAALGSSPLVASGFGRVTREITTRLAKVPGMEVACIGRSESHVLSITLGEIWMLDWLPALPVRRQFKWIGYFPLDGGPFYPPWEPMLKDVDELVAMSEFGRQVFTSSITAWTPACFVHCRKVSDSNRTNGFRESSWSGVWPGTSQGKTSRRWSKPSPACPQRSRTCTSTCT